MYDELQCGKPYNTFFCLKWLRVKCDYDSTYECQGWGRGGRNVELPTLAKILSKIHQTSWFPRQLIIYTVETLRQLIRVNFKKPATLLKMIYFGI